MLLPVVGWHYQLFCANLLWCWRNWIWVAITSITMLWFLMQTHFPTTGSLENWYWILTPTATASLSKATQLLPTFCVTPQASWAHITPTIHLRNSLMSPTNSCCLMNYNCYCNSIARTLRAKQLASRSLQHILVGKKSTCRHSQTWIWVLVLMPLLGWPEKIICIIFYGPCHCCLKSLKEKTYEKP